MAYHLTITSAIYGENGRVLFTWSKRSGPDATALEVAERVVYEYAHKNDLSTIMDPASSDEEEDGKREIGCWQLYRPVRGIQKEIIAWAILMKDIEYAEEW